MTPAARAIRAGGDADEPGPDPLGWIEGDRLDGDGVQPPADRCVVGGEDHVLASEAGGVAARVLSRMGFSASGLGDGFADGLAAELLRTTTTSA